MKKIHINKCRLDGSKIYKSLNLGNIFISDFIKKPLNTKDLNKKYLSSNLQLVYSKKSSLVQLDTTVNQDNLYRNYWYLSGTNQTMRDQLYDVYKNCLDFLTLQKNDLVLDIGCNDGTLLKLFKNHCFTFGIDPARNLAHKAKKIANFHVCDYFNAVNYFSKTDKKAKVITSIAMFYDLHRPNEFVKDIKKCLDKDGIWIIQMSYLPLMLKQNAFDNIMHEHIEYYSIKALKYLLDKNKMKIIDITLNNTNSGSFRVVITHAENNLNSYNLFDIELAKMRFISLYNYEKNYLKNLGKQLDDFKKRVEQNKNKTLDFIKKVKKNGYRVYAYGASSKGNTLLQYYGLNNETIDFVVERQKRKVGLYTINSNIPIVSESFFRKQKNKSYTLILPWHFTNEFILREKNYLESGNHFIIPLPELKII